MTRGVTALLTLMTFVGGVSIASAQLPPPTQQPPSTPSSPPKKTMPDETHPPKRPGIELTTPKNSRGVTATGCLKQERDVAGRTDIRAAGAGNGPGFVLTGAKLKGSGVETGGDEATAELYRVLGLTDAKLREHVNKQVEIGGRLNLGLVTTSSDGEPQSSGGSDGSSQTKSGEKPKGLPAITADSIKTVADSCTAS